MAESYVFSGFGYAAGKHQITNEELEAAVKKGYLIGFTEARIKASPEYQELAAIHPGSSPFCYFVERKMGFKTRNHVVPFPASDEKIRHSENGIDLALTAIEHALSDSVIHPEKIDAWFVSSATPPQKAPGIAATLKCYFVTDTNQTPATTITSACVGFNINLQRAIEYFKCHPQATHIIIAHADTLSHLLTRRINFINYVTFADAASAVVLSRVPTGRKQGVLSVLNYEDPYMIDHLGADEDWNLYMTPQIVKIRATKDIVKATREVLKKSHWEINDIDILAPHQTGNAILHPSAEILGIPREKLFQDVQVNYGNISGASIPFCLSLLKEQGQLKEGKKIVCPTAGLGGEYGAFSYLVPQQTRANTWTNKGIDWSKDLAGKSTFITGSTGSLGLEIVKALAKRGSQLILHCNSDEETIKKLVPQLEEMRADFKIYQANFAEKQDVKDLVKQLEQDYDTIDYLVHTTVIIDGINRVSDASEHVLKEVARVNQFSLVELTKRLKDKISGVILYVGSAAEEAPLPESSSLVSAQKGLHGFAAAFSPEAYSAGIKSIYYMPGIIEPGMANIRDESEIKAAMISINQQKIIDPREIAERIVKSLYLSKIKNVRDCYENMLLVRKDGYYI
ncbi:MAG: SDR family NAD(P)-dependent oxidoreductase [Candidatus Aminicenantes bacterium]|nr:MAG: SDR family NAD(P)-dependent oxidoreductase [Candidatus Aminicenantes bacterium]